MKIAHTRAMIRAALNGSLADVPHQEDPVFGLRVPSAVPGVPTDVLRPRETWGDKAAYDEKARELAGKFKKNFEQFSSSVTEAVRQAGPH
jgi:phosphoenolpyruvate carboxykinase (ATP)